MTLSASPWVDPTLTEQERDDELSMDESEIVCKHDMADKADTLMQGGLRSDAA